MNAQTAPMSRGMTVQLAESEHASPVAEADQPNAWIVTITADGGIYFGMKPVTPESLYDAMRAASRKRPKMLFVKADARASYGDIEPALVAVRHFFPQIVLLTAQPGASISDRLRMAQGFDVLLNSTNNESGPRIRLDANRVVRVNNQQIPQNLLAQTLRNLIGENKYKVIPIEADRQSTFAEVVQAIDVTESLGSQASLTIPSQ